MAEKTFKLEIVTPERTVLSQDVVSVVVPASEGSMGILANHAPLMAGLATGEMDVRNASGTTVRYAISGGFMEVAENTVRILADTAERADEIDVTRAREAVKRAEERLHNHPPDVDLTRAETALKRALNRLRVAEHE